MYILLTDSWIGVYNKLDGPIGTHSALTQWVNLPTCKGKEHALRAQLDLLFFICQPKGGSAVDVLPKT